MRVFAQHAKSMPGWGYWGNYGEINVGFSSGYIPEGAMLQPDKPHYHKKGVVYILVLEGEGQVAINGAEVTVRQNELLQIDPGEVYYHTGASVTPFRWITVCTVKDADDKVVLV